MPLTLLILAVGAFGIGAKECVIMGLLPQVGADLGMNLGNALSAWPGGMVISNGLGCTAPQRQCRPGRRLRRFRPWRALSALGRRGTRPSILHIGK
ncbi:hypothetical protein ACFW5I_04060 [Streptomyces sp. NPDC058818]|uniref:hypothetical protein n=1 Tax=Streptomyces sp. NPDC058818 TaxID=3346640 RepID=UPI00367AF480